MSDRFWEQLIYVCVILATGFLSIWLAWLRIKGKIRSDPQPHWKYLGIPFGVFCILAAVWLIFLWFR